METKFTYEDLMDILKGLTPEKKLELIRVARALVNTQLAEGK